MISLSPAEMLVANEYCKGLADKEVANNLSKSVWAEFNLQMQQNSD